MKGDLVAGIGRRCRRGCAVENQRQKVVRSVTFTLKILDQDPPERQLQPRDTLPSTHLYIRNTTSDIEVHAEHHLRVDRSTW